MHNLLLFLTLLLSFLAPLPSLLAARPSALAVWTASTADKIQPTTASTSRLAITLQGARRSYEAYQIIVTASGGPLTNVNLTASPLSDSAGHTLPAANITFFREHFIDFTGVTVTEHGNLEVPENSPTGDGRLPDALIPFTDPYTTTLRGVGAPFDVASGLNQPVWVDFYIPVDAFPGAYTGTITVTASGQSPVIVPISLTVWDFVLPDLNVVTTYFKMSLNDIINYHLGTWACSGGSCWLDWNARARTVVKRYEELAHQNRISTYPAFIPDPYNDNWDECLPPTHWEDYDAALQPYMDGTYWSDRVPSSFVRTPFSPGADWGLEVNCTPQEYTALAAAWAAHLKTRGWFDRAIVYAADEPSNDTLPAIAEDSLRMQAGDPDWKSHIMDTTAPTGSNAALLNPALGIYTVCLRCYDAWSYPDSPPNEVPYGRAEWPGQFAQGHRLWFYESNAQGTPYPTFATNTLLGLEPRLMMWGSWYEHATGFLYWDISAWDSTNPWGPNVLFAKTGDGVLLYPGNHDGLATPLGSPAGIAIDGPIPSYRLKMVRAALQDWALFRLADTYNLTDYARAQVAQLYGQLGGCTWSGCQPPVNGEFFWRADDALLEQIRANIAQAILAAQSLPRLYLPLIVKN